MKTSLSKKEQERAIQEYNNGTKCNVVCKKYGISHTTFYRYKGMSEINKNKEMGKNILIGICHKNFSVQAIQLVNELLEYGANPNATNEKGQTSLIVLCKYNHGENAIDIAKLLIHYGIDVNMQDNKRNTALSELVKYNKSDFVNDLMKLLLENNAKFE